MPLCHISCLRFAGDKFTWVDINSTTQWWITFSLMQHKTKEQQSSNMSRQCFIFLRCYFSFLPSCLFWTYFFYLTLFSLSCVSIFQPNLKPMFKKLHKRKKGFRFPSTCFLANEIDYAKHKTNDYLLQSKVVGLDNDCYNLPTNPQVCGRWHVVPDSSTTALFPV